MKISRLLKTIFMIDFVTGLLIATKEKLLENGDRWENILAANIKADSSHR